MHRRQPSAALPLSTRAVTVPEPDVLVTHLAIRCAGDAQRARLGMHGLADNGCARALLGSVIHRLPAGAARRCSAASPRPDKFSCLASAADCYCLFIDSSERAWGSRRHSTPQRPRLEVMACTSPCLLLSAAVVSTLRLTRTFNPLLRGSCAVTFMTWSWPAIAPVCFLQVST